EQLSVFESPVPMVSTTHGPWPIANVAAQVPALQERPNWHGSASEQLLPSVAGATQMPLTHATSSMRPGSQKVPAPPGHVAPRWTAVTSIDVATHVPTSPLLMLQAPWLPSAEVQFVVAVHGSPKAALSGPQIG